MPSTRHKRRRVRDAGFSLIELSIVLLVLGIVVALGQPMIGASLAEARLDAAAAEVTAALHYARETARSSGADAKAVFDLNAGTVTLFKRAYSNGILKQLLDSKKTALGEDQVDATLSYRATPHPTRHGESYVLRIGREGVPATAAMVSASFGGATEVVFLGSGGVSAGGSVVVAMGDRQRTVAVDTLTGHISSH